MTEYTVHLRNTDSHPQQARFVNTLSKRIVLKCGRRSGKTVGIATRAVKRFLAGRRQLYATPTAEQLTAFWFEVKRALDEPIRAGIFKCNESEHTIELPGTKQRIRAKTAWNADTLRGDYADDLYLDEYQLMSEETWAEVGAPMLLDNNGDAIFSFTPPSLKSSGISKASDPRHASKLFREHEHDKLWDCIHFTSYDNPFISQEALGLITHDMSLDSYRREIMAEDDDIETSWLVHSRFNESLCKIKRFTIPFNWDVFSGHDFGTSNPAALFAARVKLPLPPGAPAYMRMNDLVIFREYVPGAGYSTAQHVQQFKEFAQGYNVIRSVGGNATTEDEIRQGYRAQGWNIQAPPLNKVNAQLDRVIAMEELNKLYIFDDLYITLSQVANCMWELDSDNHPTNKIKDEAKYHCLACLRYLGSLFVPETLSTAKASNAIRYFG